MSQALRKALTPLCLKPTRQTNAGLWLDRYLPSIERGAQEDGDSVKANHLNTAANEIQAPQGYAEWLQARERLLFDSPDTEVYRFKLNGRMITGLGKSTAWENGITLHHTWGVPMIPGSTLKGLCAAFAHQSLEAEAWRRPLDTADGGESHILLFGTNDNQGSVVFHDAIWRAGTGAGGPLGLAPDIITVHHQEYYQGNGTPTDFDAPVPVPFLSATGEFLLAVSGPKAWRDAAVDILRAALAEEGVGAKTSSGYGRGELVSVLSPDQRMAQQLLIRLEQIGDRTQFDQSDFPKVFEQYVTLKEESDEIASAMVRKLSAIEKALTKPFRSKYKPALKIWAEENPAKTRRIRSLKPGWFGLSSPPIASTPSVSAPKGTDPHKELVDQLRKMTDKTAQTQRFIEVCQTEDFSTWSPENRARLEKQFKKKVGKPSKLEGEALAAYERLTEK